MELSSVGFAPFREGKSCSLGATACVSGPPCVFGWEIVLNIYSRGSRFKVTKSYEQNVTFSNAVRDRVMCHHLACLKSGDTMLRYLN